MTVMCHVRGLFRRTCVILPFHLGGRKAFVLDLLEDVIIDVVDFDVGLIPSSVPIQAVARVMVAMSGAVSCTSMLIKPRAIHFMRGRASQSCWIACSALLMYSPKAAM